MRSTSRIQIRLVQTVTVFGIYLSCYTGELLLITQVFQYHYILSVQRNIATVPPLMKEVLGNQNDTDTPVMAAIRK